MQSSRNDKAATNKSATASAMFGRITPSLKVSDPLNPQFQRPNRVKDGGNPMASLCQIAQLTFNYRIQSDPRKRLFYSKLNEKTT